MKDLEAKAQEAVPCVRLDEADGGKYRIETLPLYEADEIGTDEFPQYADWLETKLVDANGDTMAKRYVECNGVFANQILELELDEGDTIQVETAKTDDDVWDVDITEL